MFDITYYNELGQMIELHNEVLKSVDKITQERTCHRHDIISHYNNNVKLTDLINKHPDYWNYYIETSIGKNRKETILKSGKKEELSNKDLKLLGRFSIVE